ncbi:MAG: MoaD/ThiS family protein [Thiomonas sp.]|uniref:Putative Molybdopterin converting factor, small subunit n=1 Tax=mine drainage metagenome TaxID=410659 RepID=E6PUB7_9ZZZZ
MRTAPADPPATSDAAPDSATPVAAAQTVRIQLKLMATLTDYLPQPRQGHQISLELAAGTTIQNVVERFRLPWQLVHLVLVDGVYIHPEHRDTRALLDGETLAIWPPVAGG